MTAHFALYHLSPPANHVEAELSTPVIETDMPAVEDSPRLGLVVPKRHARRAVTRSLIKRQAKALFARPPTGSGPWAPGDWVIRQSRGFERQSFGSATSEALRHVVATELRQLLNRAPRSDPRRPA